MKDATVKRIRRLPIIILYYILLMIVLSVIFNLTRENLLVILKVRTSKNFPEKTFREVETKEFIFVTG